MSSKTESDPAKPAVSPAVPAAPKSETRGRPKKNTMVLQKEAELRDARLMATLAKMVEKLSPWGKGQLMDILSKGEAQPPLPGVQME